MLAVRNSPEMAINIGDQVLRDNVIENGVSFLPNRVRI
jgi:hypothetical protein